MSQGFYCSDQGKGPQLPAPSPGPHPRSGWTDQLLLENLKRFGTYNGGRSPPDCLVSMRTLDVYCRPSSIS